MIESQLNAYILHYYLRDAFPRCCNFSSACKDIQKLKRNERSGDFIQQSVLAGQFTSVINVLYIQMKTK